jgi:hypothetical protein
MLARMLSLIIIAILAIASVAGAFDGKRQGFILGGGVGISRSTVDPQVAAESEETYTGLATHFSVGYGWSESNSLVYDVNLAYHHDDRFSPDASVLQGFLGPAWYHYFGKPGHSLFTVVGLGHYRYLYSEADSAVVYNGAGKLVGIGYEFARHWRVGAYYSSGFTTFGDNHLHSNLSVIVTGTAY